MYMLRLVCAALLYAARVWTTLPRVTMKAFMHAHKKSSFVYQVCRGTAVMMVSPTSGTEEIANPFSQEED